MSYPSESAVVRRKEVATRALTAAGAGTIRITNNNPAKQWRVEQVSNYTIPRIAGCTAELYESGNFVDTNYFAGTGDTASGPPYLYLDGGEYMECVITGGPPSGQAVMTVYYIEIDR